MRALEAGYQMFVLKPVEVGELATIITTLIGRMEKSEVGAAFQNYRLRLFCVRKKSEERASWRVSFVRSLLLDGATMARLRVSRVDMEVLGDV
jgi:DNA-binding response OmpR family regulator